jgi:hypothetical protein
MKNSIKDNAKRSDDSYINLINKSLSYDKSLMILTKIIGKNKNIRNKTNENKNIFKFILIFFCFMSILIILANNLYFLKILKDKLFHFFWPSNFLNIYICTHRDFDNKLTSPVYKILIDEKSQLKEEYNLTIIETNKDNILYPKRLAYAECSKIYYIWKLYKEGKLKSKYVGFTHYSRIFPFKDDIPDLDEMFKYYDVIVKSRYIFGVNISVHYNENHIGHFLNESLDIIREKFPEYYQPALTFLDKKYAYFCNVFIMKNEDFIKWGEFVFGVLFELDRRNNITSDEDVKAILIKEAKEAEKSNKTFNIVFQRRIEGFLSERIGNIFYERHFKKIYEIPTL